MCVRGGGLAAGKQHVTYGLADTRTNFLQAFAACPAALHTVMRVHRARRAGCLIVRPALTGMRGAIVLRMALHGQTRIKRQRAMRCRACKPEPAVLTGGPSVLPTSCVAAGITEHCIVGCSFADETMRMVTHACAHMRSQKVEAD